MQIADEAARPDSSVCSKSAEFNNSIVPNRHICTQRAVDYAMVACQECLQSEVRERKEKIEDMEKDGERGE
jgi:hypothetical protein